MERRAVPLASLLTRPHAMARFVVGLCVLTLLATAIAGSVQPALASSINDRIASVRAGQVYAEKSMLTQDQLLLRLNAQRKSLKRSVKQAERALKSARVDLTSAKAVLKERTDRLARVDGEYANPNDAPAPEVYKGRLAAIRKEIRIADSRRANLYLRERALTRAIRSKRSQLANITRQAKLAVSRRGAAEGSLAAGILQMRDLAAIKAEEQAAVSLSTSTAFSWPTSGRIVQSYGCTGFRLNPRKGSCAHFHDGIDVVSGYGTPVRSVAVGVVAYSGWNPWDKEGRAYVVDVVHPDGFISRYGHLIATNRVRAGDLVYTGQVIGKMGSTGKSTGTHLHFELLANGTDVNPVSYLPTGVVRVDKTSTKAGLAGKARQDRQRAKTQKPKQNVEPKINVWKILRNKPKRSEVEPPVACRPGAPTIDAATGSAAAAAKGGKSARQCIPLGVPALAGAPGDGPPGIPLPYRGTSPEPG